MTTAAPPATAVTFFVKGNPVTKGSLRPWHVFRANGNCMVSLTEEHGARLKEWRALIATAAARAMRTRMPLEGPLDVRLTFYFARPASHTAAQRLCPYAVVYKRNDVDKLQRAVLDAGSDAALWGDDSQVAHIDVTKFYADAPDEVPGVVVTVEALS
ncbi:MAG TPA: RusA family crossover junction endodeoxyribonuclease [Dehalococcoidia bacterium]|jgi:Holliday junction resolvase RusA-like endonuclease